MADPTRTVLFVTTGLDAGGAEAALLRLLDRLRAGPVAPALASLRSGGALRNQALELNIPFLELGMESGAGRKAAGGMILLFSPCILTSTSYIAVWPVSRSMIG